MGIPGVIGEKIQQRARHLAAEAEVFAGQPGSAALDRLRTLLEFTIIPS
jgi:hypothetical protein